MSYTCMLPGGDTSLLKFRVKVNSKEVNIKIRNGAALQFILYTPICVFTNVICPQKCFDVQVKLASVFVLFLLLSYTSTIYRIFNRDVSQYTNAHVCQ